MTPEWTAALERLKEVAGTESRSFLEARQYATGAWKNMGNVMYCAYVNIDGHGDYSEEYPKPGQAVDEIEARSNA